MRRRPSPQFQDPSSEIERQAIGDGQGRRNNPDLVDELVANDPAIRLEIECAAHRQGSRQVAVADIRRPEPVEGRIAEDVIGMLMGIDDVEDRLAVRERIAASNRSPIGTLPPVSMTATPLSPITKPILAMSPRFSSLMRAISPACTNTPGATSWTGRGERGSPQNALRRENVRARINRAPSGKRILQPFSPQHAQVLRCLCPWRLVAHPAKKSA